jgi:hypothetical protein
VVGASEERVTIASCGADRPRERATRRAPVHAGDEVKMIVGGAVSAPGAGILLVG